MKLSRNPMASSVSQEQYGICCATVDNIKYCYGSEFIQPMENVKSKPYQASGLLCEPCPTVRSGIINPNLVL